jgi:hypothetical protein
MGTSDVVILAELTQLPTEEPKEDQLPKALFRVTEVLKGSKDTIEPGREFKWIVVGEPQKGQLYLLMGVDPPQIAWTTPLKMSPAAVEYLRAVPKLPAKGVERLKFFQNFFEHEESMLAFDAYEEFARASYAEVCELKPFMPRKKLLQWVQDANVSTNRKRLYFTLLSVCGKEEDLPLLESLITSDVAEQRRGLDALIACYLTLKGESGLDLIEKQFFANPKCEFVDAFSAISAIRFLATEKKDIGRDRILEALHKVLDRPALADLVIPDLARWEDWSVIDKLVDLFKNSNEETKWVRVPIVSYLQVCPKPEAKVAIETLKKIDPESVRRAETLLKWESGEDDSELDSGSSGTDNSSSSESNPTNSGGSSDQVPLSSTDADDQLEPSVPVAINVPIYEVRRLPIDVPSTSRTVEASLPNRARNQFVSRTPESNFADSPAPAPVKTAGQAELVASTTHTGASLAMIFVPLASFMLLFLLLWSVFSGWFERLIY